MLEPFSGTVLRVSHDRGEVFRSCRRVCVLDSGRSQGTFTPEELFRCPGTEAAARVSGCENFSDILPDGDTVILPQWGLTLLCSPIFPPDVRRAGLRAHHIRPAEDRAENAFPCRVTRVVQDVSAAIVLLQPEHAAADAPPLRMELPRKDWEALSQPSRLTVCIRPEDLLPLR